MFVCCFAHTHTHTHTPTVPPELANVDVDVLNKLEAALSGAILEASLARGEVAAAAAAGRFNAALSRQAAGKPATLMTRGAAGGAAKEAGGGGGRCV